MKVLHPIFLSLLAGLASAANFQPVCQASDDACGQDKDEQCSLWFYDYWVIAGKDYPIDSPLGWKDVVIPFKQHDRRAFPMYNRFHYLYQVPNKPNHFLFAPAVSHPFECHSVLYNLKMDPIEETAKTNPPLMTSRAIKAGEPLYQTCRHEDLQAFEEIVDFPSFDEVVQEGTCLDGLEMRASTLGNVDMGAFATKGFKKGDSLMFGPMVHMHRSEFRNKETDTDEELLNYVYGHPQTDLVLLPAMPVVNSINHSREPNVAVRTKLSAKQMSQLFSKPTEVAFGEMEGSQLYVDYIALRDIKEGEELFLDYGEDWVKAWERRDPSKPFRHEIGLPNFFPKAWLDREVRNKPFPALDATKLKSGEVAPVRLTTGETLSDTLHRIGLPEGFVEKMRDWADRIGVTATMEDYILNGKALPQDGQIRVRINGGTWWIRRFNSEWTSNMHYISPDDDESNEQYMVALGEAGWDEVLEGMGKYFDLSRLSMFYPSFIAVNHAQASYMHSDSDYDKVFNVLFPIRQVDSPEAEINLGSNEDEPLRVPYRYEDDHAVILGKDGMHGTAPTDYRGEEGPQKMRLVASVYMGAFDDTFVDDYVENWEDPPYPLRDNLRNSLMHRTHWSAIDKTKKSGSSQINVFSAVE